MLRHETIKDRKIMPIVVAGLGHLAGRQGQKIIKLRRQAALDTQEKTALRYQARHDELTDMLNKNALKEEIQDRIDQRKTTGLVLMDMNYFKLINDTLGHEVGDKLLEDFGGHVKQHFKRKYDTLAHERLYNPQALEDREVRSGRYGGDEFAFSVDLDNGGGIRAVEPGEEMQRTVNYLRSVVDEFVTAQAPTIQDLNFGFAIGGAIWQPEDSLSLTELFQQADAAMYEDKGSQKR